MLHTANVDVAVASVVITFNCTVPAKSITQTYGPGNHTDPDSCDTSFMSATVAGVPIPIGQHAIVPIAGKSFRVDVSDSDSGRHITVDITALVVP